jgi:hypothetical protein
MIPRDIDLAEQPIAIKDYSIYSRTMLPKLILGFNLKNKFDEKRFKIKSKYKPKKISHFKWTSELEPMFAYGIEILPQARYSSLLDYLQARGSQLWKYSEEEYTKKYKQVLSEYCLTCDECFRYLSDGIYPIDVQHLNDISRKDFTREVNAGFSGMLEKTEPWYLSVPNFKLFILTWSAGYEVDTKINK